MESVATIGDARLQQKTYCYSENAHFEVVGTNEVYRFSLGNVLRLSDRCLHIAAIFYLLISTGCSESSVPEDTVLNIPMRLRGTYSEAHTAFYEHIDKYIQIKETNPALALAELKKAIEIQFEGHAKSDEYVTLLFALDAAGEGTLPQTLAINKLVLEMVVDNNFSNEIIRLQRRSVERDEQWIAALKAEGKDPDEQYFRFIFIPTE